MRKLIIAALISVMPLTGAYAQDQDGTPSGWQTWTWEGACFAVLFPQDAEIAALDSEQAYLAIRHFPADGTRNAIAMVSGLEDPEGLSGTADVDGKVHDLLVFSGTGFVSSGAREEALLDDLINGETLRVTWTTDTGMLSQDYSLAGLDRAKRTIDTACFPQD